MKKRKTYEVSVINKTDSKTYSDQTKFYTSDTALELNFQLKEFEYDFDSAEIILLNDDDRSLVTRPVSKSALGFTYELEDDITARFGEWKGQLKFNEGDEIYVSSPVSFRIENDLNNDRPPQLTEVNNWKKLRVTADGLIDDLRVELESLAKKELEIENAETTRQQAESKRQSTFETNEINRQNTFETAEQSRKSVELTRIENEKQRNLTSVDEFIKLQNTIGGRNYLLNSDKPTALRFASNSHSTMPVTTGVEDGLDYIQQSENGKFNISTYIVDTYATNVGTKYSENLNNYTGIITMSVYVKADVPLRIRMTSGNIITTKANEWARLSTTYTVAQQRPYGLIALSSDNPNVPADTKVYWRNYKIEKGTQVTPYTKALEDYTVVTKDDYYNHIKLMNDYKDNQFNKLTQA